MTTANLPPRPTNAQAPSNQPKAAPAAPSGSAGRGGKLIPFDIIPPHDESVERCVIGAMLIAREAAEYAAEVLTPDAFYLPRTKGLFIKCVALLRVRGAVDEVILTANLKVPNIQEMRDYVGRVIVDTPSAGNIEGYCSTLLRYQHDRARLNFALKVLSDVTKTRPTGQAKPKT